MNWQFKMTAYAGHRHRFGAQFGTELISVSFSDQATAQTEMLAFEVRMASDAVDHVDVLDLRENQNENLTQMNVRVGGRWIGMAGVPNHHDT